MMAESISAKPVRVPAWAPALISALLALLAYAVSLGGTYIYDDQQIILSDPRLSNRAQWPSIWTTAYQPDSYDRLYRPLVTTTYALQWGIHGDKPWAFHAVNWLLHAAVSAAVAGLARRLAGPVVGLVAGVVFAVHPVHVEAVANIVGRAELMCALFAVLALILFHRRPLTSGRAVGVTVCALLSILSKEQGVIVAPLLVGWAMLRRRDHLAPPPERWAIRWLVLLMCWSMAAYFVYRETILPMEWDRSWMPWTLNPTVRARGVDRVLLPLVYLGRYVWLIVWPRKLSIDYGGTLIGWAVAPTDLFLLLGIATTAAAIIMLTVCFALRRRQNEARVAVGVCVLGFGISVGVVANLLVIVGTNFADRLDYLPSVFGIVLIAMAAVRWLPGRVLMTVTSIVVAVCLYRTVDYTRQWNEEVSFFRYAMAQQPKSVRLHLTLANALWRRGEFLEADRVLADARSMAPDDAEIFRWSGVIAMDARDYSAANRYFLRSWALQPSLLTGQYQQELADRIAASTRPATRTTNPSSNP